jgi:hypothetical protein
MSALNMSEILELVKTSQAQAVDELTKNFTQPGSATAGIQGYDLEAPSKKLYPLLTPLRNRIPRVGGGFAVQANWKAITGINTTRVRAGISEGNRGAQVSHTSAEYFAAYRGLGLEKSVTFEADYAAKGFEDVKALAVQQTLESVMLEEEMILLGGNTSLAMGTTPTPTLAASTTGGTLATQTLSVIVVALGLQSYWDVAGINNGQSGQSFDATTALVRAQITRTNADGSTDTVNAGTAQKSAAATVSVTGATGSVTGTVADVRGAVAYAWFWGPAGSERLGAVTTINSVSITALTGGSNQLASTLPSADASTSGLEFDGLLTIASKSALGSYYQALPTGTPGVGTTLTGAGGRVVEIDTALAVWFDKYRLQPNEIHLSFRQFQKITNLVLGQTNPNVMFTVDPNSATQALTAGRNVGKYLSPITGQVIDLIVHPNMPPGTMFFRTTQVPAYLDGVTSLDRVRTRREYHQIEWPLRTRKYEYGVYVDEVLQHYFPPAIGLIKNVA